MTTPEVVEVEGSAWSPDGPLPDHVRLHVWPRACLVKLEEQALARLELAAEGDIQLHGVSVEHLLVTQRPLGRHGRLGVELKGFCRVLEIDWVGQCHVRLDPNAPPPERVVVSDASIEIAGNVIPVLKVLGGELHLVGEGVAAEYVEAQVPLTVEGGPLTVGHFPADKHGRTHVIVAKGGRLRFAQRRTFVAPFVELRGSSLEVPPDCRVEGLNVSGTGRVDVTGSLMGPRFDGPSLTIQPQASVLGGGGEVEELAVGRSSIYVGHELAPRGLDVQGQGVELTGISLFRLGVTDLDSLRALERLGPCWPGRREAVRRARPAGPHFWSEVARMLKEKGASGRDQSISREIASDLRRRAAPIRSTERVLLEAGRIFGYGARPFRPLGVLLLTTLALTALLAWYSEGVDYPGLFVDMLGSPVTFIRGLAVEDDLTRAVNAAGAPGRAISLAMRVLGAVSLVFAVLAIRRLTRPD